MINENQLVFGSTKPLPKKTPQETKEVANVMIKFADGTTKVIIVHGENSGGFYRESYMVAHGQERVLVQEVYITNGLTR